MSDRDDDRALARSADRRNELFEVKAPISEGESHKKQLAKMPLTVLLPTAGQLSLLVGVKASLERRYEELLSQEANVGEDDISKERSLEKSMLQQVINWISASE